MTIQTQNPSVMVGTGASATIAALAEEGTRYVFGVAGTSEIPLVAALPAFDEIEYMIGLHEAVAVGMADGYARATSDAIGVALVHATQGTLNGVGYERAAFRDGVPLVVISGSPGQSYAINEPNHFLGALPGVLSQFTKWTWQVSRAAEIPGAVHRAITLARTTPQGPVHLLIPQNCMMEALEAQPATRVWPQIRDAAAPTPDTLSEIMQVLATAERPVLYAGNEVARAAAVRELVEVAELLNAPVVGEAVDRGPMVQAVNFPADHPLFLGPFTRDEGHIVNALEESDVVVALGVKTTYERVVGDWVHHKTIVQIERDGWEVGKNHPCAVGVVGDLRVTLKAIADRLREQGVSRAGVPWVERLPEPDFEVRACEEGKIAPEGLMSALDVALDKDTVIVDDSQSLSRYMKRFYRFTKPDTLYGSLASHLGWGLPAALGVQLARPDERVVSLISDGSLLFSPQALWTAARYQIPVTVLVSNNGGFKSLRQELRAYDGSAAADMATSVAEPSIDIAALATSLGVQARVISSTDELVEEVRRGRPDRPVVLDVRMTGDDALWSDGWLVPPQHTV